MVDDAGVRVQPRIEQRLREGDDAVGQPAIEKWNKSAKNGELDVLVGKRFMVTLEGHDIDDMKQLQDFASNFNFGAIAAAK
jgi:hypothetical protein